MKGGGGQRRREDDDSEGSEDGCGDNASGNAAARSTCTLWYYTEEYGEDKCGGRIVREEERPWAWWYGCWASVYEVRK